MTVVTLATKKSSQVLNRRNTFFTKNCVQYIFAVHRVVLPYWAGMRTAGSTCPSPTSQVLSVRTARYCQPVLSGTFRYCQPLLSGTVAVLSVRFVTYCEPLLSVGGNVSHYCMVLVLLSFFTITVLPACTASPYWQVLSLRVKLASRLKSSSGLDTF